MKERPILFSAPMVRALLAGTKTQTRRVMKIQPPADGYRMWQLMSTTGDRRNIDKLHWVKTEGEPERIVDEGPYFRCPYGNPGDRLWVRETWGLCAHFDFTDWERGSVAGAMFCPSDRKVEYRADWENDHEPNFWRPSIHMPHWASRITLEITGVRVERLQGISEADAKAEGVDGGHDYPGVDGLRFLFTSDCKHGCGCWMGCTRSGGNDGIDPFGACPKNPSVPKYRTLWESINGPGSWDANPWVWVVEFKRVLPT